MFVFSRLKKKKNLAGSSYPRVEVDFVHVSMGEYARDLLQALEFNLTSPVTSTLILHR